MDIGQVCVKIAGREATQKCVIVEAVDDNFVMVSGPSVKRRRCNIKHLELLPQKLTVKKGATDDEVTSALVKAGLVEQPKPKKVKEKKEKPAEPKGAKPAEKKVKKLKLPTKKAKTEKKEKKK
jgi:large subunit ribosomal protein L14e